MPYFLITYAIISTFLVWLFGTMAYMHGEEYEEKQRRESKLEEEEFKAMREFLLNDLANGNK